MKQNNALALQALDTALSVRKQAGLGIYNPISVYDCAENLGVEVRFVGDIPSMEGMYIKGSNPSVLVSSLRPAGRQAFTCAHELGHHVFNHGTKIDELLDETIEKKEPKEKLADAFASYLLMPKSAVSRAFLKWGWDERKCSPVEVYTIAGWFGVGYRTMIRHMQVNLRTLASTQADELLKTTPKDVRCMVLGRDIQGNLIVVGPEWVGRPIDIQVGDIISAPKDCLCEGNAIQLMQNGFDNSLFCGATPGQGKLYDPSTRWSSCVRVSRRGYVGRSVFRYLPEEPDNEE